MISYVALEADGGGYARNYAAQSFDFLSHLLNASDGGCVRNCAAHSFDFPPYLFNIFAGCIMLILHAFPERLRCILDLGSGGGF